MIFCQRPQYLVRLAFLLTLLVGRTGQAAQVELDLREEAAFRAAAAEAAPCVVAIETIGGLDTVGELLVGTGPSSGLIVSADGYIASSSFNFAHKPSSIIVALADGTRLPAKLIARDEARNWVLLKVETTQKLPVPRVAPVGQVVVGQWSVAVGRSFNATQPNLSVGIISAVNRIWGKAIQTDAKISSANYGGTLVDLQGRVMGLLVPLSPDHREETAGTDWYDSGIGFAVPLEHINTVLPRLMAGENLKSGVIGVVFKGPNVYADPPLIAKCRAGSPAYEAGLRPDDRITKIDGRAVEVQAQVMEQLHRRYAGDALKVTIARGTESFERELKLVEQLKPYRRPFFGLLVERSVEPTDGATIRYVYPHSPADDAQLRSGDKIVTFQSQPIRSRDDLRLLAADVEPGKSVSLEFMRDGIKQTAELKAASEPEEITSKGLPMPEAPPGTDKSEKSVRIKIAEFPNEAELYVPPQYDDAAAHGLAVLLHPDGGFADKAILERWRQRCRDLNWLLLVPQGVAGKWTARDVEFLFKSMERSAEEYRVDPARTCLIGYEEGGVFAMRAATRLRDRVRSVATVNAVIPGFTAENEPSYPTSFFIATAKGFAAAARVTKAIEQVRALHYPVAVQSLADDADDWDERAAGELLQMLAALDRI